MDSVFSRTGVEDSLCNFRIQVKWCG